MPPTAIIDGVRTPFTKFNIKLSLPVKSRLKKNTIIECQGVVVRSIDEGSGGFNLAIYFNQIKESQRKKLAQYINKFLS